ncbi:hypothetical protein HB364_24770 [Pseudoflavitalea sp. X16]|uniref:hypothetical protein n=1 Tax=Paraflavitalea devenefica TaxID=2716334 RepID=UPI00141E01B3|nr:hypothetical protein [Paraflavitalea devenefica]NII28319.1 hypothetical protein [Paraflavitalea devenefica]
MKKLLSINGVLAIMLLFICCQKDVNQQKTQEETGPVESVALNSSTTNCGDPLVKDMMDMGGVIDWGDIVISNDANNIIVQLNSGIQGMYLAKVTAVFGSQQHVTDYLSNQINWSACDGPFLFDRQKTYAPQTKSTDTIQIPVSNFQSDDCIWMSLSIQLIGEYGTWGCAFAYPYDGEIIGSAEWQSAFRYCRQDCPPPPPGDCGQLRTQTPGGWGAEPNGNNAGTYLHANFAAAFPNGLTVGCTPDYNVMLTTAQAITDLLPTGGQAAVLTQNYTNPAAIKNVLVGHLVALTLSTGFDVYDANFGQAGIQLGQMQIGSGTFAGWTVNDFLAEANKTLGGCGTYTLQQVLTTATSINENYVDGLIDKEFLVCPRIQD